MRQQPSALLAPVLTLASALAAARSGGRAVVLAAAAVVAAASPAAAQWHTFIHTASAANTFLDTTQIDDPAVNGDPAAVVVVTQLLNPGGGDGGVLNPHHVGLAYSSATGRWSIYNQDFAAMPLGAAFAVWVSAPVPGGAFRHTALAHNTMAATTIIAYPGLNECPAALLQATHLRNPGGGGGPRNDHPISVHYRTSDDRWSIHNQDGVDIPLGAVFDVFPEILCGAAIEPRGYAFAKHLATAANTLEAFTVIDHPALNDRPEAIVLATADTSNPAALDPHPIGVAFVISRWVVFNEDDADMPLGATFHLLIPLLGEIFADGFESGDTGAWSATAP